jgi:hypothetical protein
MNAERHETPCESIREQPNVSQLLHHYTKRLQGPMKEHAQYVHCSQGSTYEDYYLPGCDTLFLWVILRC